MKREEAMPFLDTGHCIRNVSATYPYWFHKRRGVEGIFRGNMRFDLIQGRDMVHGQDRESGLYDEGEWEVTDKAMLSFEQAFAALRRGKTIARVESEERYSLSDDGDEINVSRNGFIDKEVGPYPGDLLAEDWTICEDA